MQGEKKQHPDPSYEVIDIYMELLIKVLLNDC